MCIVELSIVEQSRHKQNLEARRRLEAHDRSPTGGGWSSDAAAADASCESPAAADAVGDTPVTLPSGARLLPGEDTSTCERLACFAHQAPG